MADKVKPLKIENPSTGGSQTDPFPVEADPSQDYLAAKGVAFDNNDNRLIDTDVSGNIQFKDTTETTFTPLWKLRRAIYEIFDPTGSPLISTNTEAAIKEISTIQQGGSSPGFTFGRNGAVTKGSWLYADGNCLSNATGKRVYLNSAYVNKVFVDGSNINTYTMDILYHLGGGTGLTLLGSVTVTAAYGGSFSVNWPVPKDSQLCARLSATSANNGANLVLGCEVRGSL